MNKPRLLPSEREILFFSRKSRKTKIELNIRYTRAYVQHEQNAHTHTCATYEKKRKTPILWEFHKRKKE